MGHIVCYSQARTSCINLCNNNSVDTSLNVQRMKSPEDARSGVRWSFMFGAVFAVTVAGFLIVPGSIENKALAALHGLCAQQPTHSFYFGDHRLPFDARMTGIYGGFAVAIGYLIARGRWRHGNVPSVAVTALLGLFVVALGVDGVNSTLQDIGYFHAYQPRNIYRLATGMMTGTALAVFIWMLIAQVGFAGHARIRRSPLNGTRDLAVLVMVEAAVSAIVLTGWSVLRLPLTFILMISAVAAVTGLMLSFVLLFGRREGRAISTADLAGPATVSLLLALMLIATLGGGRFLLEWWLGIEPVVRSAG